jgi:glycosyltransferase involved in cell wall biosynthesis
VQESGAGFVVAVSCEQTAAALVSLLSDQRTREVAGQAARNLVVEKYSMPAVAAQLVEHYRATRIGARAAAA